jgi:hypothetical protein
MALIFSPSLLADDLFIDNESRATSAQRTVWRH